MITSGRHKKTTTSYTSQYETDDLALAVSSVDVAGGKIIIRKGYKMRTISINRDEKDQNLGDRDCDKNLGDRNCDHKDQDLGDRNCDEKDRNLGDRDCDESLTPQSAQLCLDLGNRDFSEGDEILTPQSDVCQSLSPGGQGLSMNILGNRWQ